jgi:circadian clock protein KaiB
MTNVIPQVFKGIALLTPGGDIIYGIDPSKQAQWHVHLCQGLQNIMGLADFPHFLVPGYTATVERWLDPQTQQSKAIAEIYPAVQRYIPLLEKLFELEPTIKWHLAPWQEEYCNRAVIETHRAHFPQLWQRHNLVVRLDPKHSRRSTSENYQPLTPKIETTAQQDSYILRLFISSNNPNAEQTLANIHQLLEERLTNPYTLKVIDIAQHPEQAAKHRVIITPTLVRIFPKPVRRIVGQLDDIERLLAIVSDF